MRSVKLLAAAAAVSFSTLAFAADLPIAARPVYAPPADFGGWYLRGDIGNAGVTNGSVAYFADNGKWNFAWAAHAGFAHRLTPSVTLELAYSYIDLASTRRGAFTLIDGTNRPASIALKDITSNDPTLLARWSLEPHQLGAPQPVTKS